MSRRILLSVCCFLCACAADLPPDSDVAASSHPLEGRWRLEAVQSENTCPELDLFGAVEVTGVSMSRAGSTWTLEGGGVSMRFDEGETGQWIGHLSTAYEGCRLDAETRWTFEGVGPTSFAAWRTTTFRIHGSGCGDAVDACTVTHAVRGLR